ncbi:NAD(P)(+) transhydrogenase (Re/Si-specific) subunit beta [Sphingobacteriales bacterium UPWRP_1]|nr:NAD(P) transhydrogenase subunit beta [Sphingobacteriales bacterium TSM_CSM]PSJ78414.1 NAD(P)(+) transhydrogenase (Re/Si-specific) subunit beta [Sphingobacteriales bacterium UPWRP_1]
MELSQNLLHIIYLLASLSFILGLKMLSHPKTARNGNLIAGAGMTLAIFATIFLYHNAEGAPVGNLPLIFLGLIAGTIIGYIMAKRVKMTSMPQMVSFFNGMGGACAALISLNEFGKYTQNNYAETLLNGHVLMILLGIMIGSVSFAGSMIAFGKLEGKIKDYVLPRQQLFNVLLLVIILGLGAYLMLQTEGKIVLLYVITLLSLLYGVLFVLPIGGADMPVVISLLNSFTGLAAAFGGFLYGNRAMLTGGILVGSAGTILTILMCQAMNRSLLNVLVGAFGGQSGQAAAQSSEMGVIKEISLNDCAILCNYAQRVIVVPGYGLAVAQAQHITHEFESVLEERGVEVKYAIHPVAGRMPGHMNVLLAEADVAYDKLLEMEEANPLFKNTDVVLVIGANDVVNPAAKDDPTSPIYGMPILDVDESKTVVVLKRGMSAGYAGIENRLFFNDNTRMLFGDAKSSLEKLVKELKNI